MRVLMVSSLWPPTVLGGAELYAASLADRLRARDHDVGIVTLGIDGPGVVATVPAWPYSPADAAEPSAPARAVFHARDVADPGAARVVRQALRRFRPDVVHTHAVQGMSSLALAVPSAEHVPHVHTLHDYWLLCQRNALVKRNGARCEPRRCTGCIAVSSVRDRLIRRHPPHVVVAVSRALAREHEPLAWVRDRLRVIYNPLEPVEARARVVTTGPVTLGYLGRLTAVKGIDVLLDAFRRVASTDVRLMVAGAGPLAGNVRAAAPRVELLGWVNEEDKRRFLDRVDCLVVPSDWKDPAPLVVNEAAARRIPVIGARIGGIPELLPSGSEALLFAAGDAGALADRIDAFVADPARYVPEGLPVTALGWPEHVDLVLEAYADAAACCRAR